MGAIKTLCVSACAAALVGSIVSLMLPVGSAAKTVKVVLSAFIICCVFSTFSTSNNRLFKHDLGVTASSDIYAEYSEKLVSQQVSAAESATSKEIEKYLENQGINGNVVVTMKLQETGKLKIESVEITVPTDCTVPRWSISSRVAEHFKFSEPVEVYYD